MRTVIYALVPGILIYTWLFGWSVLVNITIATLSALLFEWLMLLLRGRPVRVFLLDGSAIITAILLSLALPTLAPWWILVLGSFFAIVVAKHLYGGLGYNTFNPAMAAYAILLVSFPRELSMWTAPANDLKQAMGFVESLQYSFFQTLPENMGFDALTSATILDHIRTETGMGNSIHQISQSHVFGYVAGAGYEFVNLGFLIGGLWLIYKKVITWHIPMAVLSGLSAIAFTCYLVDPEVFASPVVHILGGATILGAFFIATDPVTASTTPVGRIIYGVGIGLLIFAIRTWGGYPDGVAFAVLLMGLVVPLLDYYTTPKVYGERARHEQ
jgi:electron transport complex protein RnfD